MNCQTYQCHSLDGVKAVFLGGNSFLEICMSSQEFLHDLYGFSVVAVGDDVISVVDPSFQLVHLALELLSNRGENKTIFEKNKHFFLPSTGKFH